MGKKKEITGYDLSRSWFNFCFENPTGSKTNHTAVYFFAIEHCNRLGWKEQFGFPTTMVMEALGIKSYNTYINTLRDLVSWGFITMVESSKNQYSANIIALSNFNNALDKALDKALIKHLTKQSESTEQSTGESNSSIDKQRTINQLNNKPINNKQEIYKESGNLEILKDKFENNSDFDRNIIINTPDLNPDSLPDYKKRFMQEMNKLTSLGKGWNRNIEEIKDHFSSWLNIQLTRKPIRKTTTKSAFLS